jgi:hypothetical protein
MARSGFALTGAALVVAMGLTAGAALGGEGIKSGPPVGARTKPFNVDVVTGPQKGQRLCYI